MNRQVLAVNFISLTPDIFYYAMLLKNFIYCTQYLPIMLDYAECLLYSVLPFNTVQMQFPVYFKKEERYTLIEQSIECISNNYSISANQSYCAELSLASKISNLLCWNYVQCF